MSEKRKSEFAPPLQQDKITGLWWPAGDVKAHAAHMIKRVTDVDVAVKHCRKTAVAVQAGGNVGLWPLRLTKYFSVVHTFEPVPQLYECLWRNTRSAAGIVRHDTLLSDKVSMSVPFSFRAGASSRVVPEDDADRFLPSTTIDTLDLPACDLIYLDIEGHELQALAGAVLTTAKFRPTIVVESWGKNTALYDAWFQDIGYHEVERVHTDCVYIPRLK